MKIKEIAFIIYAVDDLKEARGFYEGTLGLKQVSFWGNDDGGMIEYIFGKDDAYTLAIGKGAEWFKSGATGGAAALEVENFNEAIAALKRDKRKFLLESHESPACWMAIVADPSGNTVVIHQRKTEEEKKAVKK